MISNLLPQTFETAKKIGLTVDSFGPEGANLVAIDAEGNVGTWVFQVDSASLEALIERMKLLRDTREVQVDVYISRRLLGVKGGFRV